MPFTRRISHPNQSGSALVFALIVVGLMASAGAAYLQFVTSVSKTQSYNSKTTAAFYLAEAGLAESFTAVKLGRSGQLGSIGTPAQFGNGLLWVDAVTTEDDQVRLTSTAMVGNASATLTYVLEPTTPLLGIFSEQDIEIDQVVLIDGYNSESGSYEEQIVQDFILPDPIPSTAESWLSETTGEGIPKACHLGYHNWCVGNLEHTLLYGSIETPEGRQAYEDRNAFASGQIPGWREHLDSLYRDAILSSKKKNKKKGNKEAQQQAILMMPPVGRTTGEGAALGSNGSIALNPGDGEIQEVLGDVQAGPSDETTISPQSLVNGQTESRSAPIPLPPVSVPHFPKLPAVVHRDLLPLEISSGEHAYEGLEVAPHGELVIRGPATVVVGQLTLQPGATLTLDTRSGDISLFVTEGMDLQQNSATVSLGNNPKAMTLQVDEIPSMEGERPVNLDSTSQFFGTIYSPETEVYIGSEFELFGSVVAKKILFGAGAQLHVDHAGTEGSAAPDIISWKIVEIPDTVKGKGQDPFQILGVSKESAAPLAESHDLSGVTLKIKYLDWNGDRQKYDGPESDFDWSSVSEVKKIKRKLTRKD